MGTPRLSRDTPSADMIEEYRNHLIIAGCTRRTIDETVRALYQFDRELPCGLAQAYTHELRTMLAHEDWSVSTRATYRVFLGGFFDWATDEDDPWLTYDPARRLPRPKVNPGVPDPVGDSELHRCLMQAREPFRLICILAAYEGLRPIEIAAIRREDVTNKWIKTVGKGNKPAVVPTEPVVWRAVSDLPPGALIRRPRGGPADAKWVSQATANYMRKQLNVDTTLRHLRHWHGTWLRRHHDLRVVQKRMRHSNLNTTQRYTDVTDAEFLASAGALPDFTLTQTAERHTDPTATRQYASIDV